VAQRICLYLARISPQQTIDHLVYEVSLGLHEDYSATETSFIGGDLGVGVGLRVVVGCVWEGGGRQWC